MLQCVIRGIASGREPRGASRDLSRVRLQSDAQQDRPHSRVRALRIAQVCPYDVDRAGGVQAHVRDTASALAELGHEVTIIAPRGSQAETRSTPVAGAPLVRRLGQARMVNFAGTRFEVSFAGGADG